MKIVDNFYPKSLGLSNFLRTFAGMIELSTHIEYMLLSHDEVSVPQFGTFIVRDMSSKRIDEEGIFLPPYRTVSFRWNEREAGEDFILSLSKLHNLSRHEARIMCVEYVDELQQALAEEGSVSVGSMGYMLRDTQDGQISFMPLQSGIASPAYYGLDAIPFAKLSNDVRQHRDKKQANRKTKLTTIATDPDTIIIRINRRVFNYVTAVAASIVLFFTFTSPYGNPVANESQKADTELLITPKLVPVAKPQPKKAEQPVVAVKTVEEAPVAEAVAEPEPKQEAPKEEILPLKGDGGSPYVIVLASAISKKNALSYAAKLQEQGFKAQACEFGGMVRVIIPGFETQDDAYAEIRRMKTESKDLSHAWPCYVKDEIKPIE